MLTKELKNVIQIGKMLNSKLLPTLNNFCVWGKGCYANNADNTITMRFKNADQLEDGQYNKHLFEHPKRLSGIDDYPQPLLLTEQVYVGNISNKHLQSFVPFAGGTQERLKHIGLSKKLNIQATNGAVVKYDTIDEHSQYLLMPKLVTMLAKVLDKELELYISNNKIVIKTSYVMFIQKIPNLKYPKLVNIIPNIKEYVTISCPNLKEVVANLTLPDQAQHCLCYKGYLIVYNKDKTTYIKRQFTQDIHFTRYFDYTYLKIAIENNQSISYSSSGLCFVGTNVIMPIGHIAMDTETLDEIFNKATDIQPVKSVEQTYLF